MGQQPSLFNHDDDDAKEESLNNMKYRLIYLKQNLGWRRSGNSTNLDVLAILNLVNPVITIRTLLRPQGYHITKTFA